MSDSPCRKFSDALNTALSHLMILDLKKPPIPDKVMEFLKKLMHTIHDPSKCNGVTLSLKKSGIPSQIIRSVDENVFEVHLNMALPFQLTPIRDEVRPGCVMLQTSADVEHPTVVNGFLDRKAIAKWLRNIFAREFMMRKLCDFLRDFSVQSTCVKYKIICLPVLEFDHFQYPMSIESPGFTANIWNIQAHPWYAVTQATRPLDSRSFVVWAPDWELCILNTHQHSQRLLRLVEGLAERFDVNKEIKEFNLVIKTIMLHEVHTLPLDFGDAMITFLEAVVARLQEGTVNRFLIECINVFQSDKDSVLEQTHEYLNWALIYLSKIRAEMNDESDDNLNSAWMRIFCRDVFGIRT